MQALTLAASNGKSTIMVDNVAFMREVLPKNVDLAADADLQKCGGLLEGRKIANMADTYAVPFAPHCVVSPIAQVCAAASNAIPAPGDSARPAWHNEAFSTESAAGSRPRSAIPADAYHAATDPSA